MIAMVQFQGSETSNPQPQAKSYGDPQQGADAKTTSLVKGLD
jgi:hypothetical protein